MTRRRVIAFLAAFWLSLGLLGLTLAHGWWVVFPLVWVAMGVLTASEGAWLADRKPLPGRHRDDTLWLVG